MSKDDVVVIQTGTANIASVLAGLHRAGATTVLTQDPSVVTRARRLVLPGVGSFGAAMAEIKRHDLVGVLRDYIETQKPLLAVCVGLQVLAKTSEENPGVEGLGVIDAHVGRFENKPGQPSIRIPQLGWNRVEVSDGFVGKDGYAYFANSYRLERAPEGWFAAWADHGGPFVAALQRGNQWACQFHPELSGAWGAALLQRWFECGKGA